MTFIGAGYPTDIGPGPTVAGYEDLTTPKAWVHANGVKAMLPLGGEATGMTAKVADSGAILGSVGNQPAVWEPAPGGYALRVLPRPADATSGHATAVAADGAGVVVGNYVARVEVNGRDWLVERAFRYDPATNVSVPLADVYGDGFSTVVDMTEGGRILTREGVVLEPDGTTSTPPGVGFVWTSFFASRMNERGELTGIATQPTSQVRYDAVKYTPGLGWKVLGGTGSLVSAFDVNATGDATYLGLLGCGTGVYQPELSFEGIGPRCLDDLLAPGSGAWTTAGFPGFTFVNDRLEVASLASDGATGRYGAVLLTPSFAAEVAVASLRRDEGRPAAATR